MKVEIEFVSDIVGHDIDTIKQMYKDWYNSPKAEPQGGQAEVRVKQLLANLWQYATKEKPHYPCVFITRSWDERNKIYDYTIWRFEKVKDEEAGGYYLGWVTEGGDEYDAYDECSFGEYLIIEKSDSKQSV